MVKWLMQWLYQAVRHILAHWGYWAVLAGLIGENAGLPLSGETVLMFASFLAHKRAGSLHIAWVILVGMGAAVAGDNLGFYIGQRFGPRILPWLMKVFHLDDTDLGTAKAQVERHGGATVFWARYIFGLRTLAGPLAGMLGMEWRRFLLFNVLGAVTWVVTMSMVGFLFASTFDNLLEYLEKASWGITVVVVGAGYYVWRRQKRRYKKRKAREKRRDESRG